MSLRLDGHTVVFDGRTPIEADDVVYAEGEIAPGIHRTRKVGFFRGPYEVAVIWSTGTYSSNATGLAAGMHGRRAGEFTDEPAEVEVGVARDGDLLPVVGVEGSGPTLRFVPAGQVPRILDYVAELPVDADGWEWST